MLLLLLLRVPLELVPSSWCQSLEQPEFTHITLSLYQSDYSREESCCSFSCWIEKVIVRSTMHRSAILFVPSELVSRQWSPIYEVLAKFCQRSKHSSQRNTSCPCIRRRGHNSERNLSIFLVILAQNTCEPTKNINKSIYLQFW